MNSINKPFGFYLVLGMACFSNAIDQHTASAVFFVGAILFDTLKAIENKMGEN